MEHIVLPDWLLEDRRPELESVVSNRARLVGAGEIGTDISHVSAIVAGFENDTYWRIVRESRALQWIHFMSAGVDNAVTDEMRDRNLLVTNGAGIWAPAMVEYALAAMVMLARSLPAFMEGQRTRRWIESDAHPTSLLCGKRLGIVGYGATGRRLASACRTLKMEVWATRRSRCLTLDRDARVMDATELDRLLESSDFVVLCASLNSSTREMIGERELRLMKTSAILVNVARGGLVDEAALIRALREGWIHAAMTDVAIIEPLPETSPLWTTPNLWVTPHVAGNTPEGWQSATELLCSNLKHFLDGEPDQMVNRVEIGAHL